VDFVLRDEIEANQTPGPDLLCAGWYLTKPAAHAHGGEGAINAIEGGVDTIEHAALFEERHIGKSQSLPSR